MRIGKYRDNAQDTMLKELGAREKQLRGLATASEDQSSVQSIYTRNGSPSHEIPTPGTLHPFLAFLQPICAYIQYY